MANNANFSEIGATGLAQFSGIINDDFLREWRGKEAYKRADEMRKNSAPIGALLLANELSIRKVSWTFTSDRGEEDPRIELLEAARGGMSLSWNDHIIEALTMLPFGFSAFEIIYKRDEQNRILWRKFAPRGQDTVYRWEFDDEGGVAGFHQQAPPLYKFTFLPIEKLVIYRARVERGNPEGRSILRPAWISYYYAKHIQQIEAIGIERDLAGLPVITLPPNADTTDNETSDFGIARAMVRNIRNDEQAGVVLPSPDWVFALVSTGGSRQFDTDKIVRRYESRALMSALAQFIMLGQDAVGSLALSKDSTDFFVMAVNAVADIIAETFTKYAIPRLLELNGYDAEGIKLEHTPAGDIDTTAIADFLQKVGNYLTWDARDELWLRQLIGLPEKDVEELQASRDEAQAMKEAEARARADAILQKQQPQDGAGDNKDMPMKKDGMTVTHFAANAPDDAERRRMERKLKGLVEAHMAKTKKKVMRAAREMKG